MLDRILPWRKKAAEGEYRPGPYLVDGGWISAQAGKFLNFWQMGYSPQPMGEGSAMVEACVGRYAQTVAMCATEGDHWRRLPNGGRERVENSALSKILRRPNEYQTISDFMMNLTRRLYKDGEMFAFAARDGADIGEIHLMATGQPVVGSDGSIFYWLGGNEIAEARFNFSLPIPARDVLHIRLHTPRHPLKGVSPILANTLDLAMTGAVLNQQIAYYLNEARPSFMLETDQTLTKDQTDALRTRWNEQTQGPNAGGTPILTWGLKAKAVAGTARDGQLAELLKMTDQNIALAFQMPLQILGIGGAPMGSTELLMQSWLSQGLGFCLGHLEEAFGQLFRLKGVPDEYVEFDTDILLRSAFKDQIAALVEGTGKVMTSNEARSKIGLGRKDGGDELFVQMQDIPQSLASQNWANPPAPPAAVPPPAKLSADRVQRMFAPHETRQ